MPTKSYVYVNVEDDDDVGGGTNDAVPLCRNLDEFDESCPAPRKRTLEDEEGKKVADMSSSLHDTNGGTTNNETITSSYGQNELREGLGLSIDTYSYEGHDEVRFPHSNSSHASTSAAKRFKAMQEEALDRQIHHPHSTATATTRLDGLDLNLHHQQQQQQQQHDTNRIRQILQQIQLEQQQQQQQQQQLRNDPRTSTITSMLPITSSSSSMLQNDLSPTSNDMLLRARLAQLIDQQQQDLAQVQAQVQAHRVLSSYGNYNSDSPTNAISTSTTTTSLFNQMTPSQQEQLLIELDMMRNSHYQNAALVTSMNLPTSSPSSESTGIGGAVGHAAALVAAAMGQATSSSSNGNGNGLSSHNPNYTSASTSASASASAALAYERQLLLQEVEEYQKRREDMALLRQQQAADMESLLRSRVSLGGNGDGIGSGSRSEMARGIGGGATGAEAEAEAGTDVGALLSQFVATEPTPPTTTSSSIPTISNTTTNSSKTSSNTDSSTTSPSSNPSNTNTLPPVFRPVSFDKRLQELKDYKQIHGNCNVPQRKKDKYTSLGAWCNNIRQAYKAKKHGLMIHSQQLTDANIKTLEDLGFQWNLRPAGQARFDTRLEELKAYKEKHGHTNVPRRKGTEYTSLGDWCNYMRQSYKAISTGGPTNHTFRLTKENIAALDELGFRWALRPHGQKTFNDWFKELVDYKAKFGTCNVPQRPSDEHASLGVWCNNIRKSYKARMRDGKTTASSGFRRLTEENIKSLEAVGFQWTIRKGW